MITPQPTNVMMTDPLAVQFMSQGQMGYMPDAQFLTPADYGAFRTMPTASLNNYANQDPGWFQSYLIRNRGSILGLPAYTFNTYNPAVNLEAYNTKIRWQYQDNMAAFGWGRLISLAEPRLGLLAHWE